MNIQISIININNINIIIMNSLAFHFMTYFLLPPPLSSSFPFSVILSVHAYT